jgi:hypothetical protein
MRKVGSFAPVSHRLPSRTLAQVVLALEVLGSHRAPGPHQCTRAQRREPRRLCQQSHTSSSLPGVPLPAMGFSYQRLHSASIHSLHLHNSSVPKAGPTSRHSSDGNAEAQHDSQVAETGFNPGCLALSACIPPLGAPWKGPGAVGMAPSLSAPPKPASAPTGTTLYEPHQTSVLPTSRCLQISQTVRRSRVLARTYLINAIYTPTSSRAFSADSAQRDDQK